MTVESYIVAMLTMNCTLAISLTACSNSIHCFKVVAVAVHKIFGHGLVAGLLIKFIVCTK